MTAMKVMLALQATLAAAVNDADGHQQHVYAGIASSMFHYIYFSSRGLTPNN